MFAANSPKCADHPGFYAVKPDLELLKQKLRGLQENKLSRYSKDVKDITAEDLENMVVINVLKIFPDTISLDRVIFKTDDNIFYIYLPSKSKLYVWMQSDGYFLYARNYEINTQALELIMHSIDDVNKSDTFFISFFSDGSRTSSYHCIQSRGNI